MKNLFLVGILVACALPLSAGAHASPVTYTPLPSATLLEAPSQVTVRFSERPDVAASAIRVTGSDGKIISQKTQGADEYTLSALILDPRKGSYTVRWSVVSKDDGHFTRGEYSFSVGEPAASSTATFQHVVATTNAEAFAMTLELLAHGMLWTLVILFAFGIRNILSRFQSERPLIERGYVWFGRFAIILALSGQFLQFLIKAADLAALQEISLSDAFLLYFTTAAGGATLWRTVAILTFAAFFQWSRKRIFNAERFTLYEVLLIGTLVVFAYFRAVISHGTANPFLPELSIAVNFLHVIEKDLWAGIAIALTLVACCARLRKFFIELMPHAYRLLAINLGLVTITGSYIVWLHLESFQNLLSTSWGEAFLPLAITALLLFSVRVFVTLFRATVSLMWAECVLALLLVHYSSVVILTSPPLHTARTFDLFSSVFLLFALCGVAVSMYLYFKAKNVTLSSVQANPLWGIGGALGVVTLILFTLPYLGIENTYKKLCIEDGNMWHYMVSTRAGVEVGETPQEGCMWGMGQYSYHFSDPAEYEHYRRLSPAQVSFTHTGDELTFTLKEADSEPAVLFVDMERKLHIVIASRDQTIFAHIHPYEEILPSVFKARYHFPKAGEYLVSVDYAHGLTRESRQFSVVIEEGITQHNAASKYPSPQTVREFTVALDYTLIQAGEPATLWYTITKAGSPVTYLEPYLGAAMHISAVKNDFSAFVHAHGEVHAPGSAILPVRVKDGKVLHSHTPIPSRFGPTIDTHLIFPSAGLYTVWSEFKVNGIVLPVAFTVEVR